MTHPSRIPRTATCPHCHATVPVRLSRHEGVPRLTRHPDNSHQMPSCPGTGTEVTTP